MIVAIKEIGEYALEKEGKSLDDPLGILVDDIESNPKNPSYKHILLIILEKSNGNYEYNGIDIEEYSNKKIKKYLYKQGSRNGPDITPTSRITRVKEDGGKKTTFEGKILSWFKQYNKLVPHENINFLVKVGNCLRKNKEKIQEDLEIKYSEINKKEKGSLTLKIDNKYIGDYEIFKTILVEKAKDNLYSKYGKVSKSENRLCSVCNQRQAEVYGFVDTYKFYTVDKPGFVSGGFHQEDAWKTYPVCLNCALKLEEGKKYLENNMNFNFYGFNYLIIPKFVSEVDEEIRKEIFEKIEWQHNPRFSNKQINRLTSAENEILELMSEQKNYLNLNFLFYKTSNSEFKILLYIEDVLPSRLKTLFDVKNDVDKIDIFRDCMVPLFENKKKIGEMSLEFNFGILRTFFPRISNNKTYDKYFLDITNKIFTNKPVDYNFLLRFIMQKIRDNFINNNPTKISTLKGFMLLNYLYKLGLIENFRNKKDITNKEVNKMDENSLIEKELSEEKEITQKICGFFEHFSDFFESDARKAIFLEGALTQFLLNIQYQERGATPFRVKLKGLKLDEKQIKKLLPEIQNKLEEYGKNYYRTLESMISKYFISAGNGWKMSNDEVSFYFVLGMNLYYLFKTKKESNNRGGKNE